MSSSEHESPNVKRSSKPASFADLVHNVPNVLSSKNSDYTRLQLIGSVGGFIQIFVRQPGNSMNFIPIAIYSGFVWEMLPGDKAENQRTIGM